MADALDPIRAAVRDLDDNEIAYVRTLADDSRGAVAGLLAALSHVADNEWHRRAGVVFALLAPAAAIDPGDLEACVTFGMELSEQWADQSRLQAFVAAVVASLTDQLPRH